MIRLPDLLHATAGALEYSGHAGDPALVTFRGFCFDSRRAQPGELFVALKTDRGDGHDYIADAFARGCTGALVDSARWTPDDDFLTRGGARPAVVAVSDTLKALGDYAACIVRLRHLPVVAITGSVGKTTAREAVAAALSTKYHVFRNPHNFNGRLGLPIALGALELEHQILVLEMASDAPGEIRELCAIAPPRVGIVTTVSETHLAYFGSLDEIAREKGNLLEALPADGLAILNQGDPRVWAMRERTKARVIGVTAPASSNGATALSDGPLGLGSVIAHEVGRYFGIDDSDISRAVRHMPALPGRTSMLHGVNGITLIDDTFSASPASMRAVIEAVVRRGISEAGSKQRIYLVLGDMDQLGDESVRLHREIGRFIADLRTRIDVPAATFPDLTLITQGEFARNIADAAMEAGVDPAHAIVTYVAHDAIDYVKQHAGPGDSVLVKGDTSARMERIVGALLENPADVQWLARQEPSWESVRVAKPARPTWLEVDLDAIAHNVRTIKQYIGEQVTLMAVLKADGYGHGAIKVARTALNNGASFCGVASLNEATQLRAANIDEPVLILGFTPAWHARDALMRDIRVTVYDLDVARAFSRAAMELHRTAKVHIKIDTGMGRLGVLTSRAPEFIRAVKALPGIEVEGLFTHFCCADTDPAYTRLQLERFLQVMQDAGVQQSDIPYIHAANSAATLALPESHLTMVRVGLAMYGLSPFPPSPPTPLPQGGRGEALPIPSPIQSQGGSGEIRGELRPALSWKTIIAQVKTLPDGHSVSYGATYRCKGECQIAVIPVGYADGFRRAPQNFGEVLVRGRRAPIVGRVCMDQTMLDVTGIPGVRIGDEVVLIGRQGDQTITAEDVAARIGTINYEVVSAILPRVPRVS